MRLIRIPDLRLVSPLNGSHGHWSAQARRRKRERDEVWAAWRLATRGIRSALPVTVTIVRVAPRAMDDDNLAGACKSVRDQVATELGVDDRDPRVSWRTEQRSEGRGVYAVEVLVEART